MSDVVQQTEQEIKQGIQESVARVAEWARYSALLEGAAHLAQHGLTLGTRGNVRAMELYMDAADLLKAFAGPEPKRP